MEFILIATAHFLALLSPGPDFFLIMQASLRLPVRYCFSICAGIALANGLYLVCAVLGLEVIRETGWLIVLLKYLGAGYLLFIGIMLLRAPLVEVSNTPDTSFLHSRSVRKQFLIGFMSALFNPKNAIFYLSLFTAMVSAETGLIMRLFYALWMMSVVFVWDCCVVLVINRKDIKKRLGRGIYYVEKVSGGALAMFGLCLPFF